jgi:RNA methyltransferase, TrmH family
MLSRDNKLVKLALKLKQKKYREQENKFLIEGIRFIEEGIKEKSVDYILYSEKLHRMAGSEIVLESSCDKYEIPEDLLKELADTETPQGAVAVVSKQDWAIEDIKKDFIIIADGLQDPGNLGTIIRTADAAGAGAVIIVKGTVDVFNGKTLRSTMGSIFHLPVLFYDSFEELSEELKAQGYNIYATSLEAEDYIYGCDFKKKTAIVIGNEANGVPEEHINLSTHKTKIPMPGNAESLNAATAASIVMFEVVRQRLNK